MANTPEGKVKDALKKIFDQTDELEYYMPRGGAFSRDSEPDIVGVYRGRYWALEVKGDTPEPTPGQAARLRKYYNAGAFVGCAGGTVSDEYSGSIWLAHRSFKDASIPLVCFGMHVVTYYGSGLGQQATWFVDSLRVYAGLMETSVDT